MGEKGRNWIDIVGSLFFFLAGAGTIIGAFKLKVGTPLHPQPGFFPFLGGTILAALSSILLVQAWLERGKKDGTFGEVRRPAILVIGIAIYLAILDPLGYVLATIFLNSVILRMLGMKSWKGLVASSVALSLGTYLLFCRILNVELPVGVLEGIWIF